ncbi:MAG: hypothetical protein FWH03_05865 [Firmicutes bacterium]|nr:hypothetical protein [Bacillota bacterium]
MAKHFKQTAKLKPLIFGFLAFNLVYGLAAAIISAVTLTLYLGIIGLYNLIFGITKLYGLWGYKKVTTEGLTPEAVQKTESELAKNMAICGSVMTFLVFSYSIVDLFFFPENPSNYGLWILIFVAASAFVKLVFSGIESIRAKKSKNIIIYHIKLLGNANGLVALGLTQRAILFFVEYEHARLVSGIGCAFFSLCALAICLTLFKTYKRQSKPT